MRLEQLDCFGDQRLAVRVAEPVENEAEATQDAAGCDRLALLAVESDGSLERLPGLLPPALLLGRVRPALQQRGARGVVRRGELQGARQMALGLVDVQRERPLAGEGE